MDQKLPLDGLDVWPTLTQGAKSPHEAILLVQSPTRAAVRMGDWKLLINASETDGEESDSAKSDSATPTKRKARAKKQAAANRSPIALYNLVEDIGERQDLAAQQPDRVATMRAKLASLLKDAVPEGHLGLQGIPAKKAKED